MYNNLRKNKRKGFSLVELIVVIAIMAVMMVVLVPTLLQYVEKSRAQKDDSAMGEVVEVVKLALADQDVYDECLCYAVKDNKSGYAVGADETIWAAGGEIRGLTITFHPNKNANKTKYILSNGNVNEFVADSAVSFNGTNPKSTLGAMTSNNITNELYTRVRAGIEDGEVELTSQTYRNSDYTIFITMGSASEAVVVYGQWSGTNLPGGIGETDDCTISDDCTANVHDDDCPKYNKCTKSNDCKAAEDKHLDGCPLKQGGGVTSVGSATFYVLISPGCHDYPHLHTEGCYTTETVTLSWGDLKNGVDAEKYGYEYTAIDDNCIGQYAFNGCVSLTSIEIPNGVASIEAGAFMNCTSLTSIGIPASVTRIGEGAFSGCYVLTSIEIPNGVTEIGTSAFSGCSNLKSIDIPDSVTSIGDKTFWYCKSLTSIEIPDSVTNIGNYVFYFCTGLTTINFGDTTEKWNSMPKGLDWKLSVPSTAVVKCTDGTISI